MDELLAPVAPVAPVASSASASCSFSMYSGSMCSRRSGSGASRHTTRSAEWLDGQEDLVVDFLAVDLELGVARIGARLLDHLAEFLDGIRNPPADASC